MALNKDILGAARVAAKGAFNGLTIDQVNATYGSMDGLRLAMEKADSDAIINHLKNYVSLMIPGTPMVAGPYTVTGTSVTGTMN